MEEQIRQILDKWGFKGNGKRPYMLIIPDCDIDGVIKEINDFYLPEPIESVRENEELYEILEDAISWGILHPDFQKYHDKIEEKIKISTDSILSILQRAGWGDMVVIKAQTRTEVLSEVKEGTDSLFVEIKNNAFKYGVTVNTFAYERVSKWIDGVKEKYLAQLNGNKPINK